MLIITIEEEEFFDEETNEFTKNESKQIILEHSLVSLSKWESKYQVPFLTDRKKDEKELFDYIKCMVVYPENFDDSEDFYLSDSNLIKINEYIESAQSATTFRERPGMKSRGRQEIVTAELVYYWLVAYNIPFEVETWNLNRLFALIKICGIKNSKDKKMPLREVAQRNRELNEQRKAQLGTTG